MTVGTRMAPRAAGALEPAARRLGWGSGRDSRHLGEHVAQLVDWLEELHGHAGHAVRLLECGVDARHDLALQGHDLVAELEAQLEIHHLAHLELLLGRHEHPAVGDVALVLATERLEAFECDRETSEHCVVARLRCAGVGRIGRCRA